MNNFIHKQRIFEFDTGADRPLLVYSSRYNLEIKQVLVERFGKDLQISDKISYDAALNDMPWLLQLNGLQLDLQAQEYEKLAEIYEFFINEAKLCESRSKQIYQRSAKAFKHPIKNEHKFKPEDYLETPELMKFYEYSLMEKDPWKFANINSFLCECKKAELLAARKTDGIDQDLFNKWQEKEMEKLRR